ncbi:hypothetical protein CHS0354_035346 [Potamilus streckersoni]|uniref:CinA-like protein n=1 Tax=Potamilus streckersoni TaxID=2493646 RepID=A0AAE0VPH9_9BIVA|nr:hypothetical protein CHS0354_035346 [Potamilus streckersoni]
MLGGRVSKIVKVGDIPADIIDVLKTEAASHQVLIINGGMGPTVDDYTCVWRGKKLNADALAHLENWVAARGYVMNEANRKQAYCRMGAAGFYLQTSGALVVATPGVPSEMKYMWKVSIRETVSRLIRSDIRTHILTTFGCGESLLQEKIDSAGIFEDGRAKLGFRASMPYVEIKITSADKSVIQEKTAKLRDLFSHAVISETGETLPDIVHKYLTEKKLTLTVCESCTGGLISSKLTAIPGASLFFKGGYTVYSNELKEKSLGISPSVLESYGAVSAETAREMLLNGLRLTGADAGIAVTGIAGPDGGTEQKPVGTVYIAVGSISRPCVYAVSFKGDRRRIIDMSCYTALDLLRRFFIGHSGSPLAILLPCP